MRMTTGDPRIGVGLVDGPVVTHHADLASARIRLLGAGRTGCANPTSRACEHGTFLAGVLVGRRGSPALALCPGVTLLVRPIFEESTRAGDVPQATPAAVGRAIADCIDAGARIVNVSAALGRPSISADFGLRQALDFAASRGVLVVAAAGNQGELGSSEITRHPGVIPVVAYDRAGRPLAGSNLSRTAAHHGIGAPGEAIVSLGAAGAPVTRGGTSVAAAVVTGTIALLWSLRPETHSGVMRRAVVARSQRRTIAAPLLDAQASYQRLVGALTPGTPVRSPARHVSLDERSAS
jgi:subtilisin family serine protease